MFSQSNEREMVDATNGIVPATAPIPAAAAATSNANMPCADNESALPSPANGAVYMINAHEDSWTGVLPPSQMSRMEQLQLQGSYELMQRGIAARRKKEEEAREIGLKLKEELKAGAAFEIATTMVEWEAAPCVHPQCPRKGLGMAASDCYVVFSFTQPPHEQATVCWECLEELWEGECLAAVLGGS